LEGATERRNSVRRLADDRRRAPDPRIALERRWALERRIDERRRAQARLAPATASTSLGANLFLPTHRALHGLLQMARRTIQDSVVTFGEAQDLVRWVDEHPEIAGVWPVPIISRKLRGMVQDGALDERESSEALATLRDLVGQDEKPFNA
jgi:hypothetical protein